MNHKKCLLNISRKPLQKQSARSATWRPIDEIPEDILRGWEVNERDSESCSMADFGFGIAASMKCGFRAF
jgi:hypothetical protein